MHCVFFQEKDKKTISTISERLFLSKMSFWCRKCPWWRKCPFGVKNVENTQFPCKNVLKPRENMKIRNEPYPFSPCCSDYFGSYLGVLGRFVYWGFRSLGLHFRSPDISFDEEEIFTIAALGDHPERKFSRVRKMSRYAG